MHTYARVDGGVVAEIIDPLLDENGDEIPVTERFHPSLIAEMVDVTGTNPRPLPNWSATNVDGTWSFQAPSA